MPNPRITNAYALVCNNLNNCQYNLPKTLGFLSNSMWNTLYHKVKFITSSRQHSLKQALKSQQLSIHSPLFTPTSIYCCQNKAHSKRERERELPSFYGGDSHGNGFLLFLYLLVFTIRVIVEPLWRYKKSKRLRRLWESNTGRVNLWAGENVCIQKNRRYKSSGFSEPHVKRDNPSVHFTISAV